MPAGTPGWGGQLDWAPGEAQVWRLGRATECRLASDWAQGRGWGTAMGSRFPPSGGTKSIRPAIEVLPAAKRSDATGSGRHAG